MDSDIKPLKFMFLDYWPYEVIDDFKRITCSVERYHSNPVVESEREYEKDSLFLYGTALKDPSDNLIKLWYTSARLNESSKGKLLLAVSKNGYDFEKPDYEIVKGTNIVIDAQVKNEHTPAGIKDNSPFPGMLPAPVHGPSIIYDETDDDVEKRYKLVMCNNVSGKQAIRSYMSRDGIHWSYGQDLLDIVSDCHIGLCKNQAKGYQITCRKRDVDRRVWTSFSNDFVNWSDPVLALEPCLSDDMQTQFYGMQISNYGPYTMGWISMFYTNKQEMKWSKMDGYMDVQTAFSRDGHCFHRVDAAGVHLIPVNEKAGAFDSMLVRPSTAPVLLEDKMLFYYEGRDVIHASPHVKACIGVSALRPDGFVAMRSGMSTGVIVSRPFCVDRPGVAINANAAKGECRVGIYNADGSDIEGFSLDNCIPLKEDKINHTFMFRRNNNAVAYTNKPIRIKVYASFSDVYSVTMTNGTDSHQYWDFKEIQCINPQTDLQLRDKVCLTE
jgi:hypothetical protein